jgi:hypothetical protein
MQPKTKKTPCIINGQSRDTVNIDHRIQNKDKQNKKPNTKQVSNMDPTKNGVNPDAREG